MYARRAGCLEVGCGKEDWIRDIDAVDFGGLTKVRFGKGEVSVFGDRRHFGGDR